MDQNPFDSMKNGLKPSKVKIDRQISTLKSESSLNHCSYRIRDTKWPKLSNFSVKQNLGVITAISAIEILAQDINKQVLNREKKSYDQIVRILFNYFQASI